MKRKNKPPTDEFDKILFDLAEKNNKPVPEHIHNAILKTIDSLEFNENPSATETIMKNRRRFSFKNKFRNSVSQTFGTVITKPAQTIAITLLVALFIATGVVGARQMSEKIFNNDNVRLDNIGISNEFIFTKEMEEALVQNVPLNLVQLNEDYYISIHSILLDEINFFTVFELHCKNGVTDDLKFNINDLIITDENKNVLYNSDLELRNSINEGYHKLYNTENCIKQLFFMFGNDSSKIEELNFSFSNIEVYRYIAKQDKSNENFKDIHITSEPKNISIGITKDNYNTIQEYVWEKENTESKYNVEKVLLTKTGLYIMAECNFDTLYPIVEIQKNTYIPTYNLPLKRTSKDKIIMLFSYNIINIPNNILLYNEFNKQKYNLIPKQQEV